MIVSQYRFVNCNDGATSTSGDEDGRNWAWGRGHSPHSVPNFSASLSFSKIESLLKNHEAVTKWGSHSRGHSRVTEAEQASSDFAPEAAFGEQVVRTPKLSERSTEESLRSGSSFNAMPTSPRQGMRKSPEYSPTNAYKKCFKRRENDWVWP